MELAGVGIAIWAIAAGGAWLNIWALPRRATDVSTEVANVMVILALAGVIGIVFILVGLATVII